MLWTIFGLYRNSAKYKSLSLSPWPGQYHDGGPVEERAEDDEDVPDAVVVAVFAVVDEEVGAHGVGYAFSQDEDDGLGGDVAPHGFHDEEDAPAHEQIEDERELGEALPVEDLVDDAGEGQ